MSDERCVRFTDDVSNIHIIPIKKIDRIMKGYPYPSGSNEGTRYTCVYIGSEMLSLADPKDAIWNLLLKCLPGTITN